MRPPPLRLGEEGTTSLPEARTDPLPLSLLPPLHSSPPSLPAALSQRAVPKTRKRNLHQNRGDPLACPAGYSLNPFRTPTPQGEGCHHSKASLWSPITKVEGKRGWEKKAAIPSPLTGKDTKQPSPPPHHLSPDCLPPPQSRFLQSPPSAGEGYLMAIQVAPLCEAEDKCVSAPHPHPHPSSASFKCGSRRESGPASPLRAPG